MNPRAYYNEIEPYAAQWLRNLIAAGHIAPGDVDERSIVDVQPDDLRGYTQCHFFAGVGVWSHALRSAGWDDARPVWTGSCPCQPFSSAGQRKGTSDERHLWPHLFRLIQACRPVVCFGEQVASPDGLKWLDLVQADLEGANYASGAVDTCAAGVGAPHIRQRLYWVAHTESSRWGVRNTDDLGQATGKEHPSCNDCETDGLGNPDNARREGDGLQPLHRSREGRGEVGSVAGSGADGGVADSDMQHVGSTRPNGKRTRELSGQGQAGSMADTCGTGSQGWSSPECGGDRQDGQVAACSAAYRASPTDGFWAAADWLWCRDGKWRPVEPGAQPLAHGVTSRVGRLRAYGNAIVAPQAQAFVTAAAQVLGMDLSIGEA